MQEISNRESLKKLSADNKENFEDLRRHLKDYKSVSNENQALLTELENHKKMFREYMAQFHNREASLETLLEMKENEITENLNKMRVFRNLKTKLEQESVIASDKLILLPHLRTYKKNNLGEQCEEFCQCLEQINGVGELWRDTDTDSFDRSLSDVQDLVARIENTAQEVSKIQSKNTETCSKNKALEAEIKELEKNESSLVNIKSKIEAATGQISKQRSEREISMSQITELQDAIEKVKAEKESLANKLEEVYEKLVTERSNSQQLLEDFEACKTQTEKIMEKLNEEKILKKRLTEQLQVEIENHSKIAKELDRNKDIDQLLGSTLTELGQEGAIEKAGDSYFHNGNPITLYIHQETFIVVKDKTGPIPLTDYLLTAFPHLKQKRSENSHPEKSKSPIRSNSSLSKTQKTPLRDRKKPFR